jgi:hypothetical protein
MQHGLHLEREHGAASIGDYEDFTAMALDPGDPEIHSPQMTTGTGPQQRMQRPRCTWRCRNHG